MADLLIRLRHNTGGLIALALFIVLLVVFIVIHPRFNLLALEATANQGAALALVAMGQTLPVLTGGLDLSIGAVLALTNALGSELLTGTPWQIALGILAVIALGCVCGLINGLIVVYGRIQPIIATLATGAVYTGLALLIRPAPGGAIDEGLSEALTYSTFGVIPTPVFIFIGLVVVIWLPLKNSVIGRGIYAVGSSEIAAYMSGVPIKGSRLVAYTGAGFFASLGGLFLGFQTLSGDANGGVTYTLNSIAAVVIGGTSLFGGSGSAIGSIFGAFVMRTVGDLLIVFDINPVLQPLFVGIVLLLAVSLGSLRLLRIKNRLDFYR
jgi:ribose transport system permease protein